MIGFDDHDLLQYFFVTVQLREKGQEIVGIYLDQLSPPKRKIEADGTYMNHNSPR